MGPKEDNLLRNPLETGPREQAQAGWALWVFQFQIQGRSETKLVRKWEQTREKDM